MSTLNVSNITDGTTTVGTSYVVNGSAKAWVNFNGTGTVAVQGGQNVTSITDTGTGTYTVNFTASMSDVNFAVAGWGGAEGSTTNTVYNVRGGNTSMMQTGAVKIRTPVNDATTSNTADVPVVCVSIHGDLA